MKSPQLSFKGLKLEIVGYEFPEISAESSFYDANWLVVNAELQTAAGSLTFREEACLLTFELEKFAETLSWFLQPLRHGHWRAELIPLETNLRLHVIRDNQGLTFGVELTVYEDDLIQSFKVQYPISEQDFRQLNDSISEMVGLFPVKEKS